MNPQNDRELESVLRRAADHLTRQGSQYREHPVAATTAVVPAAGNPRRIGLRVLVVSAVAVPVLVGGMLVVGRNTPSARLEPQSSLSRDPDGSVVSDSAAVGGSSVDGSTPQGDSLVDGSTPTGGGRDPYLGPDDSVPVVMPPDDSVPPIVTVLPPPPTVPGGDGDGPDILGVQVPDVVAAGDTATFRWRARDVDAVSSTGIVVGWASGIYTPCGFGQLARLESGTREDGVWVYSCVIPSTAVSTEYSVEVHAQDGFGNWSNSTGHSFTVQGGSSDSSAPVVSDVRVLSGARVGEVLTTTWTLTDASGIQGGVLWVAGPGGAFTDLDTGLRYVQYDTMQVTKQCTPSGESCEFTQTVRIDPASPSGSYTLWSSATDTLGNKHLMPVLTFTVAG